MCGLHQRLIDSFIRTLLSQIKANQFVNSLIYCFAISFFRLVRRRRVNSLNYCKVYYLLNRYSLSLVIILTAFNCFMYIHILKFCHIYIYGTNICFYIIGNKYSVQVPKSTIINYKNQNTLANH